MTDELVIFCNLGHAKLISLPQNNFIKLFRTWVNSNEKHNRIEYSRGSFFARKVSFWSEKQTFQLETSGFNLKMQPHLGQYLA